MTKVVQIQYSTKSAGSSALRLQNAFSDANIESSIISLGVDTINKREEINYLSRYPRIISMIDGKIQSYLTRNKIQKFGLFSYPVLGTNISNLEEVKDADFIYLHWVLGGFLNIPSIKSIFNLKKPVIIIMHDMWWFTGGCHYSFTCEKYTSECNNCQMFSGEKKRDFSAKEFDKKIKLYSNLNNVYFVSPSKWLYNCAKSSKLLKRKPIFYIPNAIDDKTFKPFEKKVAKHILNIDVNETVIAFGATHVNSPYKGWNYLQKALQIIKNKRELKNITILIFGSGYKKNIADQISFKTRFLGRLTDDYAINLAYNAADVFVIPSLADNQPTTVMESLCCGTPVVGFDIGGIPDMISHKINGYLAKYKNAEDIAEGIKFCIKNNVIGKILPMFQKNVIVEGHIDLMNKIVNNTFK